MLRGQGTPLCLSSTIYLASRNRFRNMFDIHRNDVYICHMKRYHHYMGTGQMADLHALSVKHDVTVAELIRTAVNVYLKQVAREERRKADAKA